MAQIPSDYFTYKLIRDPLYGFIALSKTEIKLIDTPAFRRLLNIKQLSHAFLVYPSAIHTRFEHCLGVNHLANQVAQHLNFDDEKREIIRLAGLLHDVGHGPFSHLFENVLKRVNGEEINHEKISTMLIKEDPDISSILQDKGKEIIQLLEHEPVDEWNIEDYTLAADIVSGPLDVDKMDYLRRDSYHIGVAYGQFDLHRLIHTITSTKKKKNKMCIDSKGMDAVENYRLGRYLMHAQVYKHHTRTIGDQMFLQALTLALDESKTLRTQLSVSESDPSKFLEFYTSLNDHSIYDIIMEENPDGQAARILNKIQKRQLLKKAVEFFPDKEIADAQISDEIMTMKNAKLNAVSDDIADKCGIKRHDIITYISEVPVHLYGGDIWVMWKGIPRKLDGFSPLKARDSSIRKFYIFGPGDPDIQQKIRKYAKGRFQIA